VGQDCILRAGFQPALVGLSTSDSGGLPTRRTQRVPLQTCPTVLAGFQVPGKVCGIERFRPPTDSLAAISVSLNETTTMPKRLPRKPIHPGEILREQFMADFGVSMNRLARDLRVPVTRISEIVNQHRSVTSGTALRLARYFGTTPEFWMNLQTSYDLATAGSGAAAIERNVRPIQAA
jgi:addiction module HigA family antidote